jgi:hypothetical protein
MVLKIFARAIRQENLAKWLEWKKACLENTRLVLPEKRKGYK